MITEVYHGTEDTGGEFADDEYVSAWKGVVGDEGQWFASVASDLFLTPSFPPLRVLVER